MTDIRQLQYFVTSARLGSFSEAAQALYTSQPHVSMVVRSLERELGMTLLERRARGVSLTKNGERIFAYAVNILKNAEMISLAGMQKNRPFFSAASNPSSRMAALFSEFVTANEADRIQFRYREGGVEQVMDWVSGHEAQMGFVFVPLNKQAAFRYLLERKNLEFTMLTVTGLVLYAGVRSAFYGIRSIAPDRLGGLRYVQMEEDFFTLLELSEGLLADVLPGTMLDQAVMTNSDHMVIQLLQQTDLCNLGTYWRHDRCSSEGISVVSIEGCEETIGFGYLKRKGEEADGYGAAFLEWVAGACGKNDLFPSF